VGPLFCADPVTSLTDSTEDISDTAARSRPVFACDEVGNALLSGERRGPFDRPCGCNSGEAAMIAQLQSLTPGGFPYLAIVNDKPGSPREELESAGAETSWTVSVMEGSPRAD
jgi:hypothetical protein